MTPGVAGLTTRIGFRRDVKLFLAALVGYLIVIILALLLAMQNTVLTFVRNTEAQWERQVDGLGRELEGAGTESIQTLRDSISARRWATEAIGVELRLEDGRVVQSGLNPTGLGRVIERQLEVGSLRVLFDDAAIRHEIRRIRVVAVVCFVSVVATAILLMLYIPKILRPVEEMLEHAAEIEDRAGADEAQYLVSTFRRTIDTLREQKAQLEQLHGREKSRADDLERIASTLKRSIVSGLVATDPDGSIVELNEPARRILLVEDDEVEGRALRDILEPGEFTDSLVDTIESKVSIARREVTYNASGREIPLGVTTVPLFNDENRFLGVLAVFTDLTEVRTLEQRVREMQTLADLGEIAAGIAHEFRNSLSTINGNLRLIQRMATSDELRRKSEAAKSEADLLARAVDSLMAFARPIEPEHKRVDLTELLSALLERYGADTPNVKFSLSGSKASVLGDPTLLRVAFENVIRNSIDALGGLDRDPVVDITVNTAQCVTVRIADNGHGLDPADAARFLLPFQSGKASGFGLGLAMTRRIVVAHGGHLELTGEPGRGAEVTIELPLA